MKKPIELRTTFDTYAVIKKIGEGGSGVVYQVRDSGGILLAAKFIDPDRATKDKLKRFRNELGFGSRPRHPAIVRVLDNGITDDGAPFFIMPWYENSLRSIMGKTTPAQSIELIKKLLDGLEAAHLLGVVHRDIKPENILVDAKLSELVIADFGIARFEEDDLLTAVETKHDARLANFVYAAPEQRVRGRDVDHRADIYALGLIINEIFTGEVPQGTGFKTISSVSNEHRYLDDIAEKMLSQDPKDRFSSLDQVKQELIAKGLQSVSLQKASQIEKTVVPVAKVDDLLVHDPMKIVEVDWTDNLLTIKLNHKVTPDWLWAFQHMGNYSFMIGKEPERFAHRGNEMTIEAYNNEAQDLINHFKNWLLVANKVYVDRKAQAAQEKERAIRNEIAENARKERERAQVLGSLRF